MIKAATVTMVMRDAQTNEPVGTNSVEGATEDEGATVTMGIGNLPGLATAPVGDITVVLQTLTTLPTRAVSSITEDFETGLQTITFNDP